MSFKGKLFVNLLRLVVTPQKRFIHKSLPMAQKKWNIGRINHVALATHDLGKATSLFKDVFGANVSEINKQPAHGVNTVFVDLGETKVELLGTLGDNSPIEKFLEKNKIGGMHHICIEVDNIQEAMKDLKSKNIRLLGEEAKIGAHGKPVIFLHPRDCNGVLIELEEV